MPRLRVLSRHAWQRARFQNDFPAAVDVHVHMEEVPREGAAGNPPLQRPNDVAGPADIEIPCLQIDRCEKFRGQMNCDAYNRKKTDLFIFLPRKFSRHPSDIVASADPASLDHFRIDPPQAQFLPAPRVHELHRFEPESGDEFFTTKMRSGAHLDHR